MRSPPPDSSCRWMIAANSKLFALRILYHVREAAWYNCPSKGGCRVSGEPLGITRYNNRSAVIVPYSFSNYHRTTAGRANFPRALARGASAVSPHGETAKRRAGRPHGRPARQGPRRGLFLRKSACAGGAPIQNRLSALRLNRYRAALALSGRALDIRGYICAFRNKFARKRRADIICQGIYIRVLLHHHTAC